MSDPVRAADAVASAEPAEPAQPMDTRRAFVERLAKTAALPVVLPLMLSMSTAALAY